MEKIKELTHKLLNRELITYLIFGVLTTVVNLVVFYILANLLSIEDNIANAISIVIAILFAYFTNSLIVFKSKLNWKEFFKFILGRSFSFVVEMIGFFILNDLIKLPNMVSKIIISVIVIILNFFISKYFTFKK